MEEFSKEELKNERWKDIFGYDGMYQVSDLGRVRSKKYGDWRVLRERKSTYGYLQVALCKDGKIKWLSIHRLVASAFIPNDNIFNTEINHRDECKQNNKVSNLEWCSAQYNMTYNNIHHRRRRRTKQTDFKDLYNPNITYEQNLEVFRANGVECSRVALWKLRKDLGLINRQ